MASNGRIPASQLRRINGGHMLQAAAAASFMAMDAEAVRRYGVHLVVIDGYRPLGAPGDLARGRWSQWAAWERYLRGGNLAARPGTSNHGLGLAIDLGSTRSRYIIDKIGRKYGWSKGCSDAAGEWWHIKDNPSCTGATWKPSSPALPTVRRGQTGPTILKLNKLLHNELGFKSVPRTKFFGARTQSAVKRFQKKHGLHADGVVGPTTWRALLRAARR